MTYLLREEESDDDETRGDRLMMLTPPFDKASAQVIAESDDPMSGHAYSPDGRRIAFLSTRSGVSNIWVCDADGSNPVQLTSVSSFAGTPRWSPDGRWLSFDSEEAGDWNVYTLNLVTGATCCITEDKASDGLAAILPDGRTVAFLSDRGGNLAVWYVLITGGSAKKFFDLPADWGQLAAAGWNEEKLSWGSE